MKQISSLNHPLVKHLVKLREDRSYRYEQKSVLIEGFKLINEACQTSLPKALLACSEANIPTHIEPSTVILVTDSIMKKVSGMVSSEGLVAEVSMPTPSSLDGMNHIVALDAVSDPGNMGTLLRTALALGWNGAFILPNSCDPFNDKAIRSGRGAQLRFPIAFGSSDDLRNLVEKNRWQTLVADLEGTAPALLTPSNKRLLVLGNEAHGPSQSIKAFCKKVTIPMPGEMESLNVAVAGSILMYILKS